MNIKDILKFCPPKQQPVGTCPADLAACQGNLAACNGILAIANSKVSDLNSQLTSANSKIADLTNQLAAAMELGAKYILQVNGPPAPDKSTLRLLPMNTLNQLLQNTLGQRYSECASNGGLHYAWPPWLICKKADLQKYLDFYNANVLPLLQPYTTEQWTDTHGQTQEISIRSCSEFSGHFYGMRAQWLGWSGLCWGIFWAQVQSLLLSGGHAFNWTVVWDAPYDEQSSAGLEALQIEPQTSGDWDIRGKAINASARIESLELKPMKDTPLNYVIVDNGLYLVLA